MSTCTQSTPVDKSAEYCEIFDKVSEGLGLIDLKGRIVKCNKALALIFGFKNKDELTGKCILRFIPRDTLAMVTTSDWMTKLKQPMRFETELNTPNQTTKWIYVSFAPQFDGNGVLQGAFGVVGDLTDRKAGELQDGLFRAVLDSVAEAVVITDVDGSIEYVNPAFVATTGFDSTAAIGANPRILNSGHHDEAFYSNMWTTIRSGKVWKGILVNKKADGTLYTEDETISPIFDSDGKISKFVAVKRDVTTEIESQRKLAQSEKLNAIGVLSAGIAHDFNNIMTTAVGYASFIESRLPDSDPNKKYLNLILHEIDRATSLARQLLTFSRQDDADVTEFELNQFLINERAMWSRLVGEKYDLQIVVEQSDIYVKMSANKLSQVLMNLVINARDAMPSGGEVVISSEIVDVMSTKSVLLRCFNNGLGIPEEIIDKIFDPFYTTKETGKGTGLGLSLSRDLILSAGGRLYVESTEKDGVTFTVELPLATAN
ncbi:MAG: PAS domain S-box protein [bacterium]|nr:PAS domain S-box protein [bacterium]